MKDPIPSLGWFMFRTCPRCLPLRRLVSVDERGASMDIPGFAGRVLTPKDEGYDEARAIWNGAIGRRPRYGDHEVLLAGEPARPLSRRPSPCTALWSEAVGTE